MHVAIVGAAGMIGRKLARALATRGQVGGVAVGRLTLLDVQGDLPRASGIETTTLLGDVADAAIADRLVATRPDIVFHVAATAMGQADADFAAGYRINFDTVRSLLESIRKAGRLYRPRVVYASSIGVYGAPFPAVISDDFIARPDSSYGAQKLMSEVLIGDYARCGFIEGIALRLPTLSIRPGRPTFGNSGFFSNIIREPLEGRRAALPVPPSVRHWLATPRTAVAQLLHAAALPSATLAGGQTMTMPGLSLSVQDLLDALAATAGPSAVALVDRSRVPIAGPDDYPQAFSAERARDLGFPLLETSFTDAIRFYQEDDGFEPH